MPIFRGVVLLKSVKKMCMCFGVKIALLLEKGYKWILALGSPKIYYCFISNRSEVFVTEGDVCFMESSVAFIRMQVLN